MILPLANKFLGKLMHEPPLGWAQLSHKKVRLLVALSGIAFADILIFMQLGFHTSLFGSVTNIHEHLQGDLFLMSTRIKILGDGQTFAKPHLYQAAAVEGVASASPFYYGAASWVNPWDKKFTSVDILAFDPNHPVFNLPSVNQQLAQIQLPDRVLVDSLSHPDLGPVATTIAQGETVTTEVSGRRIKVGGTFTLGSTLFTQGYVITSDWNYLRLFGGDSLDNPTLGILNLEPNADLQTVKNLVQDSLPSDVKVMTHQEFIEGEKKFWADNHPAGTIFNFGVIMGFVVGVVIVYQVLYADVNDHLAEYATLKAMGYSDLTLLGVVVQESVILAVMGFAPGFGFSIGMYQLLANLTRMPLAMQTSTALRVLIMTVVMCLISAVIAMRKLQSADPADVF